MSNDLAALNIKVTHCLSVLPLVDKSDLSPLAEIVRALGEIAAATVAPKAMRTMAERAQRLAECIIMAEMPFERGLKKLGEALATMAKAVEQQSATESRDIEQRDTATSVSTGESQKTVNTVSERTAYSASIEVVPEGVPQPGLMPSDLRDLVVKFAVHQKAILEDFEAYVLEMEKGNSQAAADAVRRFLHTWKGEFEALDLSDYAALIHQIEDKMALGKISAESLLRFKDLLATKLERFAAGYATPLTYAEHLLILGDSAKKDHSLQSSLTLLSAEQNEARVPGRSVDVDPALLADFITEARDHIHTAESGLLDLESDAANAESLNTVFRACHTIKGVSGFLGLKEINAMSHCIENVMDQARHGTLALQPGHIDLLLEAFDCLKTLVASLEQSMSGAAYEIPAAYASLMERLADPSTVAAAEIQLVPAGARLGDILVQHGTVSEREVAVAAAAQQSGDNRKLGEILIEKGHVSPRQVAAALATQAASRQSSRHIEETVRVPVERLDQLVDAIGEAVIAQSMLIADPVIATLRNSALEKKVANAALIMRKVQELSMSLRMVSIRSTFQKMARLVRDLAKKSGKDIDFFTEGEDTELDKSVVENIGDPLIHMLRNAIDHGIEESAEERIRLGKPARARVSLRAFHKAGNIYVEVSDDGRGLDREAILAKATKQGLCSATDKLSDQEIYQFIFRPGFSTAKKVTDVSGRGVGMDVVRKNIQAMRGSVEIHTEKGKGTTFSIRLPLTLAIIDGMIVRAGKETYIIPTLSIIESLQPRPGQVETVLQKGEIIRVRNEHIRFVRLARVLEIAGAQQEATHAIAIIAEDMLGKRIALLVDAIVGQQQVVIKNIGEGIEKKPAIAGGAIMSDGSVSLILDIGGLMRMADERENG